LLLSTGCEALKPRTFCGFRDAGSLVHGIPPFHLPFINPAGRRWFRGDPAINVADLQRDKVRLEREIAHAEHEWLVAQEAYEAA
jgi:hypothetical protein